MIKMNKINNKPIGIFDSGIGGLTVLDRIAAKYPNEEYFYLGDTLNCPYGVKTTEQLIEYVGRAIKFLENNDVKMIVIGCNTATVNSYNVTASVPIMRIIEPTAKKAKEVKEKIDPNGKIIVLATNYTIDAKGYERFLGDEMYGVRSSDFVLVAESGKQNTPYAKEVCERVMKDAKGKGKVVILGCTHFGLLENDIRYVLGDDITTIESSDCIVDSVGKCLEEIGYNESDKTGKITINVTGDPKDVHIEWFKRKYDGIYKVED